MEFQVTKEWQELPFKMITIVVPIFPGMRIVASDEKPTSKGILYTGKVQSFYSEKKLWIKLQEESKQDVAYVEVENFI
ncbi:MAG: hypothetical protein ACRC51_04015 [Cetobacterium sp.]